MTPDEVLDKAADLIDFNGLAKGLLVDNEGGYCSENGSQDIP